ncbi:MAG: BamA/TamA family outer membrane protein [Planctomycetes bacterium]|nr:BamA/TamA family outer membrane protein [Planctomycetota bacterium]
MRPRGVLWRAAAVLVLVAAGTGARAQAPATTPAVPPKPDYRYLLVNHRPFDRDTLIACMRSELERFEREDGVLSHLDDAAYALECFYRMRGYPDAEVAFSVRDIPGGKAVVFTVNAGLKVEIESVSVLGNFAFDTDLLLALAECRALRAGAPYVERDLGADMDRIEALYVRSGYPDARVEPTLLKAPSGRTVQVLVRVEEGALVHLAEVRFAGNRRLPSDILAQEVARFLVPPRPFHRLLAEEVRAIVLDRYGGEGFPFARIEIDTTFDRSAGKAVLTLVIEEGARARFGTVRIAGNDLTRDSVILGQMLPRAGERYDQDRVWKSEVELYNTGLFSRVSLKPGAFEPDPEDPAEGTLDLDLVVAERDPIQLEFYGGYGSYEKLRGGVALRDINLFGTGRMVETKFKASFVGVRAELNFEDRMTLGRNFALALRNSFEMREFPSFDLTEYETALEVGYQLTRELDTRVRYRYRSSDAENVSDPQAVDRVGAISISGFTLSATFDSRDNPIEPESGLVLGASYEWADRVLGGDIDFHRVVGTWRGYLAVAPGWVLAAGVRGGSIVPFGRTEGIPIQERFFSGGASTVRSFKEFELGPRSPAGDPQGGEAFLVANTELRYPIYKLLAGTVFADLGQVWQRHEDFASGSLSWGLGGGLHLRTPIGPARVDAAWNPDPNDGEDRWNLHVSVGYAF